MAAPDIRSLFRSGTARTVAIILALVVAALMVRGAGDSDTASDQQASGTAQPVAPDEVTGDGQVLIGDVVIVPRPAGDDATLRSYRGRSAEAQQVLVLSVPADEGFWVGSGPLDRIWVQMTGAGESPLVVRAGQHASFTGTVVAHDSGFAARAGVNVLEGASRLTSEGAHLQVPRASVILAG